MTDTYVRRVSPGERGMLIGHQVHRYQVDGIVEGRGEVDIEVLRTAVASAAQANPGVRVRLRGSLYFSKWVDSGIAPEVRLITGSDWDGNNQHATEFMSEPFDALAGGPIADVLVVPCRDGMTRLVFRCLHAAIDGGGVIHWIREVFRALRGETLQGSPLRLMDLEVQQRHRADVAPSPKEPVSRCIAVVEPGPPAPLRYVWRRIVINQPVFNLLTKTIVFLAQWARRRVADGDVTITVPVDLRGLRVDEMGIGNLTGYLNLKIGPQDTPRSLMQLISRRIRERADCNVEAAVRMLWWLPIRFIGWRLRRRAAWLLYTVNRFLPTGGVVSMGNLKPEWFSFPGFAGRALYGVPGATGRLNVIFISYPTETMVIFSAPAPYNHQGQLDQMIDVYRTQFSKRAGDGAPDAL